MYLLDTNVISNYRKSRPNPGVGQFFETVNPDELFLPVQLIGEIQAGIAKKRRTGNPKDLEQAQAYEDWLENDLLKNFGDRIIEFDTESARLWGTLLSNEKKDPHTIDKQIAAIAMIRDMTVVTQDKGEAFVKIPGVKTLNPFTPEEKERA